MADAVYRDYDAAALYAQYDNRAQLSEEALEAIKANQNTRSAEYRVSAVKKHLDVKYGNDSRERLDIYLPEADTPPMFAFMHGGYWQWNDKEGFDFLAKELNAHGAAFANIEYSLCPAVTLAELTNQCQRAIAHLWKNASAYGYDANKIIVSGHSAGGHLTAMMQSTDWPAIDSALPSNVVAGGLPISGVYDVEPIRLTPLNEAVQLGPDDVAAMSPMFLPPLSSGETIIAFGGDEYDEFDRQAEDLAKLWAEQGAETSTLNMPGRDHFTALSALAEPDHDLFAAALKLLGLK